MTREPLVYLVLMRRVIAVGLVIAAAYHVLAIAKGSGGAGRHALFVLVNLLFAAGFWRPFRGFIVLVALLALQQLASHGGTLLRVLEVEQRIDWPSVVVLVVMPLAVAVVALETRLRNSNAG